MVNYLTRYLTGGPISDYRITAADEQSVTFMAREGTRLGGERKQVPITLSLKQFIQRWCLHILPGAINEDALLRRLEQQSSRQIHGSLPGQLKATRTP